jgi:hypothetical protein
MWRVPAASTTRAFTPGMTSMRASPSSGPRTKTAVAGASARAADGPVTVTEVEDWDRLR